MTLTVSVVVVTAGRPQSLSRCLAAIEAGECVPHELVVVDQSWTSQSTEVGDKAAASTWIRTRHLHVPRMGVSAARNLGASRSQGDHVAFTDDDCVPSPEWLAALIEALETENANAATGAVLPLPGGPRLVAVSSRTYPRRRIFAAGDLAAPWEVGSGGNLLVSRELFERAGGFDVRFGPGGRYHAAEDIELLDRLLASGAKIVYEPKAVVYHEMKSRAARLRRRYPYGYGLGALLARRQSGGSIRLAAAYGDMQAHALLGGLKRVSPREVLEPILMAAGFTAGAYRGFRDARSGRAPSRPSR
jgi:GT2 family glycosyltransferase